MTSDLRAQVVLDTDISSQLIKGTFPRRSLAYIRSLSLHVTFVTVGELCQWTETSGVPWRRKSQVQRWLDSVKVIDSDEITSHTWGVIAAEARRRGRIRPHNDSWIAACCLSQNLPLVTGNVKDFAHYVDAQGLRILTL